MPLPAGRVREILLDIGADGLEPANLALDFMVCHDKLRGMADAVKSAAIRIVLTLEQMEADGDIVTTDAINEPLEAFYAAYKKANGDHSKPQRAPDDAA